MRPRVGRRERTRFFKGTPSNSLPAKFMPSQKSQGTAAPPVASGPNAASSRPQSAASTIASGTSVSESKLASTREEELNGLLLVRVTEAKNCHFPTNALVPTANADEKSMPYVLIEFDKNQTVVPAKSVETVVNLGVGLHWKHRAHLYDSFLQLTRLWSLVTLIEIPICR